MRMARGGAERRPNDTSVKTPANGCRKIIVAYGKKTEVKKRNGLYGDDRSQYKSCTGKGGKVEKSRWKLPETKAMVKVGMSTHAGGGQRKCWWAFKVRKSRRQQQRFESQNNSTKPYV